MKKTLAYQLVAQLTQEDCGMHLGEIHSNPPIYCDACQTPFSYEPFLVHAPWREQYLLGNFCASCYLTHGDDKVSDQIPIYQQQEEGVWLLVAGFNLEGQAGGSGQEEMFIDIDSLI